MEESFSIYEKLRKQNKHHSILVNDIIPNLLENIEVSCKNTVDLLKSSGKIFEVTDWRTSIDKINIEDLNYPCATNWHDCKHEEISYEDLQNEEMFTLKPDKHNNDESLLAVTAMKTKTNISEFKTAYEELQNSCKKKNVSMPQLGRQKCLGLRKIQESPVKLVPEKICDKKEDLKDERLSNIDEKMIELITSEIMHKFKSISWDSIAGLTYAKSLIKETIIWPLLRPDIFTGLRKPPRGILLFGPPGTGKTLIGKCIAAQSKSTFFSISASSLTSKWIGDGEKMVRALFAVAAVKQPSVVFIDEIDSLLCQRSETEHESSRRIKTEFLVQLDGAATSEDERILIVGATNRPQELDEAARRRLVRRLYIPLPDHNARIQILKNLMQDTQNCLNDNDYIEIAEKSNGYSGADMDSLCREASMEPIRLIPVQEMEFFNEENVRPIKKEDFDTAFTRIRASVSQNDLQQYEKWNNLYGSGF